MPFDHITHEFNNKILNTKNVHMRRGNRTKNKKSQKISSKKKIIKILFVFDIFLEFVFFILKIKKEKTLEKTLNVF